MNSVLDEEWHLLQGGKINLLPAVAEKKNKAAQRISDVEQRLEDAIALVLKRAGVDPDGAVVASFRRYVSHGDVERLSSLIARRKLLVQEVAQRNQRHLRFIRERLRLGQELLDILTGRSGKQALTYTPGGGLAGTARMPAARSRRVSSWLA